MKRVFVIVVSVFVVIAVLAGSIFAAGSDHSAKNKACPSFEKCQKKSACDCGKALTPRCGCKAKAPEGACTKPEPNKAPACGK